MLLLSTGKRKPATAAGSPRPRGCRRTGPTPPAPPLPDDTLKTQFVNRKCKLGPLLRYNLADDPPYDYRTYKVYLSNSFAII